MFNNHEVVERQRIMRILLSSTPSGLSNVHFHIEPRIAFVAIQVCPLSGSGFPYIDDI